jgi:hypothetical protein
MFGEIGRLQADLWLRKIATLMIINGSSRFFSANSDVSPQTYPLPLMEIYFHSDLMYNRSIGLL